MASVDPIIPLTLAVSSTAQLAWDSLHLAYAKKSQTRIFSLCNQLARLSKGSLPVTDYVHQVRSISNELATAGATVTNDDLVVKILSGLGSYFCEFSTAIRARDSIISHNELNAKLIEYDSSSSMRNWRKNLLQLLLQWLLTKDPPIQTTALLVDPTRTHSGVPTIIQMLLHRGVTPITMSAISFATDRVILQMFAGHSLTIIYRQRQKKKIRVTTLQQTNGL